MRCVAVVGLALCVSLAGCGVGSPAACVTSFSLGVNPVSATADHMAAAPGNQAVLEAYSGETAVSGNCALTNVLAAVPATWTSSDTMDVQLSNSTSGAGEVATCVNATSGPVTVTASYTSQGTTKTATTQLTCK